jgi:hypothetical protein
MLHFETEHQTTAFRSPCYDALETLDPAFRWLVLGHGTLLSVILTVNVGFE